MYKMYLYYGNKQRSNKQEKQRLFMLSDIARKSANNTCVLANSKAGKGIGKCYSGRQRLPQAPIKACWPGAAEAS